MKCDECLPLVEEYVDGELEEPLAARVAEHLSLCATCEEAFAGLVREQEMYAGYRREIEITPQMWQGVRARIEQEKAAPHAGIFKRGPGWLAGLFDARFSLRPAFTAALILIALGVTTLAVVKFLDQSKQTMLSQVKPSENNLTQVEPGKLTPNGTGEPATAIIQPADKQPAAPAASKHERQRQKAFLASASTRSSNRRSLELTPVESESIAETARIGNDLITNMPQPAGDPQLGIARHVEQAQMLLRSFRNIRLAETSHAPDISYEKEQSRRLLYRNIVLRREAATQGNAPAEKLLGTLEPILLDIANLPARATARDVRAIEQRMRKKEIVAALQIHSLIAPNSY